MLNAIPHELLRRSFNFCLDDAAFAIDGVNTENVQTGNAVDFVIDGVFGNLGVQAEIDISALSWFDAEGNSITTMPALADGSEMKVVFCTDSSDTVVACIGDAEVTADAIEPDWPTLPSGYAPFGGLKVVNASGAAFTLGTTALDAAGITDTYYDICMIPPRAT